MRKKILIILIIVFTFTVIAVGGAFYVHSKNNPKFVLVKESGNVFYKEPLGTEYLALSNLEIPLPSGSFIKTENNSYARVFLPDNSLISIDQATEIQITIDKKNVGIDQLIGKTWNRVQTVSKGGEYKVETPNTIAAVRGTIFGVGVDNENLSRVFVEESNVEISRYEFEEEIQRILESTGLTENEIAEIIRDSESFRIEKRTTEDNFKNTFWYKRNKIIDEEFKKLGGKKGKELRKLLLQALQQREDYKEFLFGLTPSKELEQEDVEGQLKQVYDITKINDGACSNFTQNDYQLAIDKVNAYSSYIQNYNDIYNLLVTLKQSCVDSELTLSETEEIKKQVDSINGK